MAGRFGLPVTQGLLQPRRVNYGNTEERKISRELFSVSHITFIPEKTTLVGIPWQADQHSGVKPITIPMMPISVPARCRPRIGTFQNGDRDAGIGLKRALELP